MTCNHKDPISIDVNGRRPLWPSTTSSTAGWLMGCRCQANRYQALEALMVAAQDWRGLVSDLREAEEFGWSNLAETHRAMLPATEEKLVAAVVRVEEVTG